MNGGIAIFVKTPGHSALKTRLAAGMGADAERWYRHAIDAVKSVALEAREKNTGINAYWAVAETDALQNPLWQTLPRLQQAEGDLGERMGRVMRMLVRQHGFGILVGADAPQICAEDIQAAADFLSHANPRIVLGPATDGGFWCVGSNQTIPVEVWQSVAYSQPDTYRNFVDAFSPFAEIMTLRTLTDVDEVVDLVSCNEQIKSLKHPTPEQLILLAKFGECGVPA